MRRDERFASILDRAAEVFAARGFAGATVRDVATAAQVSPATLYRHVSSKEDLYYQVQRRILTAAVASASAAHAARTARDRLRALTTDHIRRVMARPGEAEVIRGMEVALPERQSKVLEALRAEYLALVSAAIDGVVRPKTKRRRDAERRVQCLLGMADRVAWLAVRAPAPSRPETQATAVLTLFLDGARKGR